MIDRNYLATDIITQILTSDYGSQGENDILNGTIGSIVHYKESDFFTSQEIKELQDNWGKYVEILGHLKSTIPDDMLETYEENDKSRMHTAYFIRKKIRENLGLPTVETDIIFAIKESGAPGYGSLNIDDLSYLARYYKAFVPLLIREHAPVILETAYRIVCISKDFNGKSIDKSIMSKLPRRIYSSLKRTISTQRFRDSFVSTPQDPSDLFTIP